MKKEENLKEPQKLRKESDELEKTISTGMVSHKTTQNTQTERQNLSIKFIYRNLKKFLQKKKFYFNCSSCDALQFTNEEIRGIYYIEGKDFAFIIDPTDIRKFFNIKKHPSKGLTIEDNELNQTDCIYQETICQKCSSVLGRFIRGVTREKEFMREKIIVLYDKISCVQIDLFDSYTVDLRDCLVLDEKGAEEIRQFKEVNEKLSDCLIVITDKLATASEYIEIKPFIDESESFIEILERLAKYINYLRLMPN